MAERVLDAVRSPPSASTVSSSVRNGAAGSPEHVPPMSTPLHASHDQPASQLSLADADAKAPLQLAVEKKDGSIVVGSSTVPEHIVTPFVDGSGLNEFAVMSE